MRSSERMSNQARGHAAVDGYGAHRRVGENETPGGRGRKSQLRNNGPEIARVSPKAVQPDHAMERVRARNPLLDSLSSVEVYGQVAFARSLSKLRKQLDRVAARRRA